MVAAAAAVAVDGKGALADKAISKNVMKKMSPAKPQRRQEKKEKNKNFAPLRLGGEK